MGGHRSRGVFEPPGMGGTANGRTLPDAPGEYVHQ
jgi:hypothetical protein